MGGNKIKQLLIKKIFGDDGDNVGYIHYDSENEISLDKYLDEKSPDFVGKPTKHNFIFIKEMARCAKTYKKKFVGLWYERYVKDFNDDVVIQGLLGRATGYDDNGDSIIFTNEESIERYQQLWDKDFSDDVKWFSNSTTCSGKKTRSKKTFNACVTDGDIPIITEEKQKEPKIKKFYGESGQNEMIKWSRNNIKIKGKIGPKTKKIDNFGFYKGAIRKGLEILSTEKVYKERRWGFGNGPGIRSYPCYSDVNDKNTLQWWLIWYE